MVENVISVFGANTQKQNFKDHNPQSEGSIPPCLSKPSVFPAFFFLVQNVHDLEL